MTPVTIRKPVWTDAEIAILRNTHRWTEAAAQLPHRSRKTVRDRWYAVNAGRRRKPDTVPLTGSRPPVTPEEIHIAKILSAVKRIADREGIAINAGDLIDALAAGDWRGMSNIDWQAREVVGRDVQ